ncbi:unnamed protein product [Owenia fusiformis]|uniref:Uncharacterized protein n=1 Tax=Owenia fusiformis TaxID=6347 RepID=A0A8J1U1Z1_OWEFU|nr:unnamed protein product [Owenia fusiformis]
MAPRHFFISTILAVVVTIAMAKIPINKHLKVVTIETEPWMMIDPNKTGLAAYSGYMADYVRRLSDITGFSYEFYPAPDGRYGSKNETTGEYDGMIGEVIKKNAHFAAGPISITSHREIGVNFVQPFVHTGNTILIRKPSKAEVGASRLTGFTVLQPFSTGLWLISIAAFFLTALFLWLLNNYDPYEYGVRATLGHATEREAETFGIQGSLWYAFTTLQWQGFERSPHSVAAKVLSGFWFVYVTLTLLTYTGSLVNCLSIIGAAPPPQRHHIINSIEELFSQNPLKVDFGWLKGGATDSYFQNKRGPMYDVVRAYIDQTNNTVATVEEGLKRVREENYAFIVELSFAKTYINQKPCNLITVGDTFSKRGYGIPIGHEISDEILEPFHQATLEMNQNGEFDALERKWFVDRGDCWSENANAEGMLKPAETTWFTQGKGAQGVIPITIPMFWGPLTILCCGMVIAAAAFIGEVLYYKYKGRYDTRGGPRDQLNDNLTENDDNDKI